MPASRIHVSSRSAAARCCVVRKMRVRFSGVSEIAASSSINTLRLVMEAGGFLYSSDAYADDLPYWIKGPSGPHLIIPYTLDANDMRFVNPQGFGGGEQFFTYLKDSFDVLYAEGAETPRMMSVGLHCRLVGRPGRLAALARFLDHVEKHERVWLPRRIDIARHWHAHHKPPPPFPPPLAGEG